MELKNQVVIVTGGAVRVGRQICLTLAQRGARLFCHYHTSEQAANSLAEEITATGGEIRLFRGDLSRLEDVNRLVNEAYRVYGQVDALINNAAVFFKTPLGTVTEQQWDLFQQVNLKPVFFLSQEVGLRMKKRGQGKIINIADAGAEAVFPAYIPYSVSKAGVLALTKGLAKALAPQVQVNCVNPGPVMIPEEMPPEERTYAIEQTLLKREGSPLDVARTVRFLIEEGDYMTGAVIPVDGGRHIR